MVRVVAGVLDEQELAVVCEILERAQYDSGRVSARGQAAQVKQNLQAAPSPDVMNAEQVVVSALHRSAEFQALIWPRQILPPLFARYESGMSYGRHHDQARIGGFRADVSVTIFLSPRDSYDGGELVIELDDGERVVKLEAGSAVVYSAGPIHRVAEVSRGVRLAAVLWAESYVRDDRDRKVLQDLAAIANRASGDDALTLRRIRGDLYRRWSG
jgi:PKHD-type hydroxylase